MEGSRDRDPIYSLHFSPAAAEASYLLRVTQEPLVALRALATIEAEARRVTAAMVVEARQAGHSWSRIAEALGVTRQAAQARFGASDVDAGQAEPSGRPKKPQR